MKISIEITRSPVRLAIHCKYLIFKYYNKQIEKQEQERLVELAERIVKVYGHE